MSNREPNLVGKIMPQPAAPFEFDAAIDITADLCPMTFVRTRLALDRLPRGGVLKVRLKGVEPLENVPAAAVSLGHTVLHRRDDADGTTTLWLRKGRDLAGTARPM